MTSSSLANWDGSLSAQASPKRKPPIGPSLSFGSPTALLSAPAEAKSQSRVNADAVSPDRRGVLLDGEEIDRGGITNKPVQIPYMPIGTTKDGTHFDVEGSAVMLNGYHQTTTDIHTYFGHEDIFDKDADADNIYGREDLAEWNGEHDMMTMEGMLNLPYGPDSPFEMPEDREWSHQEYPFSRYTSSDLLETMSSDFHESTLFTPPPPPVEQPINSLFTPSPSPSIPAPPTLRRTYLSYVSVPPFPKGLTKKDYRGRETKRRRPEVDVHQNVAQALQTSLVHNENIGHWGSSRPAKSAMQKKKTKVRSLNAVAGSSSLRPITLSSSSPPASPLTKPPVSKKKTRAGFKNATAGPSSLPGNSLSSISSGVGQKRKHNVDANDSPNRKQAVKKPKIMTTKKPKMAPVTESIDLTGVGEDMDQKPIKTKKLRLTRTRYNRKKDVLNIFIRGVPPTSLPVLYSDTRHVRPSTPVEEFKEQLALIAMQSPPKNRGEAIVIKDRLGASWFVWPPPKRALHHARQEDIFIGDYLEIWDEENNEEGTKKSQPKYRTGSELGGAITPGPKASPRGPGRPRSPLKRLTHVLDPVDVSPRQPRPALHQPSSTEIDPGSGKTQDTQSQREESPINKPRDEELLHNEVAIPSLKALGKRRAVSPIHEPHDLDIEPSPFISVSSAMSATSPNEMSVFRPLESTDSLLPLRSSFSMSPSHAGLGAFLQSDHPLTGTDSFLEPHSSPNLYRTGLSSFLPSSHSIHPLHDPNPYEDAAINPWIINKKRLSREPDTGYGNGTIDPSLLGGQQLADNIESADVSNHIDRSPSPSHSLFGQQMSLSTRRSHSHQYPPPTTFPHIPSQPSRSRSPSSLSSLSSQSPASSRSPSAPQSRYSPDTSTPRLRETPSESNRRERPRRSTRYIPTDMIMTEQLDLSFSSGDENEPPSTKVQNRFKKKSAASSSQANLTNENSRRRGNWPQDTTPRMCHQCRNRHSIKKMECECGKLFCIRCLVTRYPGKQMYDPTETEEFVCPPCKDICSCDVCTRKRGETYVPLRSHKPTPGKEAIVEAVGRSFTPLFTPSFTPGPVTYWAAMYDLEGRKVGNTFVGGDGKEDIVVFRPLHAPRKRVFAGAVQALWGLGTRPALKDLEPSSGRRRARGRQYIGNRAILFLPRAPMRGTDLGLDTPLSSLSVLSSLQDDVLDEGGEGECSLRPSVHESDLRIVVQEGLDLFLEKGPGFDFSPDSLGETDVLRAITLGLRACGVGVDVKV